MAIKKIQKLGCVYDAFSPQNLDMGGGLRCLELSRTMAPLMNPNNRGEEFVSGKLGNFLEVDLDRKVPEETMSYFDE